jgi:hypothetical protein
MVSIRNALKAVGRETWAFDWAGERVQTTPGSRGAVELLTDARAEVGDAAIDRLRWLVAQLRGRDVGKMTKDERVTFDYGLRALVKVPALTWHMSTKPLPMSVLTKIQLEIRSALREFLAPRDRHARLLGLHGWRLPALSPVLHRNPEGSVPAWRITHETADTRTAILHGVAALLMVEGDRLRRCPSPTCGEIFVKVGRRQYCSSDPGCGQDARVDRRRGSDLVRKRFATPAATGRV